jgi:hypothetical protein
MEDTEITLNKPSGLIPVGTLLRYFYEDYNSTSAGTLNEITLKIVKHSIVSLTLNQDGPSRWVEITEPIRIRPVGRRTLIDTKIMNKPYRTKEIIITYLEDHSELPPEFERIIL